MLKLMLRGFMQRKLRLGLTATAIALGVALMAGTYVLTDTINRSFAGIFQAANKGNSVVVVPRQPLGGRTASQTSTPIDEAMLARVRAVAGVKLAAGGIFRTATLLDSHGKRLTSGFAPAFVAGTLPAPFESFSPISGRVPSGPREVAIDDATAERAHVRIGEQIEIADVAPVSSYRVVGIVKFAGSPSFGGASAALLTLSEAQRVVGEQGRYDHIDVAASEGVSATQLRDRIRAVLPASVTVRTGAQQAAKQTSNLEEDLGFLRTFLLIFAYVALFVGAFIIFNTFSITIAQRTRELGLLRTFGASRAQVLGEVLQEGALLGVIGAGVGLLGGIALAPALDQLFKAAGANLPTTGTVLQTRTIVVSLAVGVGVTVLAGLMPALRATRVPPLAAMREGVQLPRQRWLPRRRYLIVKALARAIGGLFGWRGVTAALARENSIRQPGRTMVTAAALMIGIALVAFVAVLADGTKATIDRAVNRSFAGDLIVESSQSNGLGIPIGVAAAVRSVPGVAVVAPVAITAGRLQGGSGNSMVTAIDPATFGRLYKIEWKRGSSRSLAALAGEGAILAQGFASQHHLTVGDELSLLTPTGQHVHLRVAGIATDEARLLGNVTIGLQLARSTFGLREDTIDFVSYAPGVSNAQVQPTVDRLLSGSFPQARSRTAAQFKREQSEQINALLALIYVLLALSVIVSLFGIVNTLILSIYERTRELGMMRAIGTTRRQIRQIIRYESLITALIGGVFGLALGVVGAVIASRALAGSGYVLAIPVGTLIVLLIVAAVAGLIAAQLPARRAAKMDMLQALGSE